MDNKRPPTNWCTRNYKQQHQQQQPTGKYKEKKNNAK